MQQNLEAERKREDAREARAAADVARRAEHREAMLSREASDSRMMMMMGLMMGARRSPPPSLSHAEPPTRGRSFSPTWVSSLHEPLPPSHPPPPFPPPMSTHSGPSFPQYREGRSASSYSVFPVND